MKIKCDLIKVSTTVTIAPCWLWMRGSTEPPSHVELVETSRWRVLICQVGLAVKSSIEEV
jgi:hypothetical protein